MAFRYDTICHFWCYNLLSSPAGTVFLLFGREFGTRAMWAVMQMEREEDICRQTIGGPWRSHLLKHGFFSVLYRKPLWGESAERYIKEAQLCFFMPVYFLLDHASSRTPYINVTYKYMQLLVALLNCQCSSAYHFFTFMWQINAEYVFFISTEIESKISCWHFHI